MAATHWLIRGARIDLRPRPLVMGIVNVTPDSFSDGGRFLEADAAVGHALSLEREGADILDLGGESTRPGSKAVPTDEELRRILPVVQALKDRTKLPISVDTRKAEVADATLDAGAHIINDVSSLADPRMAPTVARYEAGLVLMHMKGEPGTMQRSAVYDDVVAEVFGFLQERVRTAEAAGVPRESIAVDPGLGFGKRTGQGVEDNAVLLRHLDRLAALGRPILVGASRKTFIGNILGLPVDQRLEGSLAAAAVAVWNGAQIVRTHDVMATRRVVDLVQAVLRA